MPPTAIKVETLLAAAFWYTIHYECDCFSPEIIRIIHHKARVTSTIRDSEAKSIIEITTTIIVFL